MESKIISFLRTYRLIRGLVLLLIVAMTSAFVIFLALFFWLNWLPDLWLWGFGYFSWKTIVASWTLIYLISIPFMPIFPAFIGISEILKLYEDDENERMRKQIDAVMHGQDELEKSLQAQDNHGLIKLVRYSRLQLQAYYQIGLSQTQRSFKYSIVAMWIGFIVLAAGVVSYLMPSNSVISSPNASAQQFALLGGLIIEMVSAAFLWVYKSSIYQLNYFYEKQHINHNALLSFGISETMQYKDDAKLKIIERLLSTSSVISQPDLRKNSQLKSEK